MMKNKTKALTLIVGRHLSSDGFVSLLGIGALRTISEGCILHVFARKHCVPVCCFVDSHGNQRAQESLPRSRDVRQA